ncbi:TPA: hypothetical protein ACIFDL_002577 [Acinetobacter nosocomialis]|uniref:hypothetical protein n=1 Tax=Acinetobacter nosocomialis TaxID=106654 RepID=UPI0034CE047A
MKKIVLLGLMALLVGCKEANTGLDKKIINTTYDKCADYLADSLKSPSSLKIGKANISTIIPSAEDINSVFGALITKNGLVKDSVKNDKTRFRELIIDIDYEASNSFGASIRGAYQCSYIYSLSNDETSPTSLNTYLYKLKNNGENIDIGTNIPIVDFNGSNLYLNKTIKEIVGKKDSQFNEIDNDRYKDIETLFRNEQQNSEAEKLRESWNKAFASSGIETSTVDQS